MPLPAPALDSADRHARLAALKATLSAKGLLVDIPDAPAGPPPLATGWPAVDEVLGGGFPRRAISEVLGAAASGKTTLAAASLAPLTRAGSLAAWIDCAGELHPPALAAAGVDLARLLVVRPGDTDDPSTAALWAAEVLLQSGTFEAVVLDASSLARPPVRALDRRAPVLRGAAEAHGTALLVIAAEPFGLPVALRVRVRSISERAGGERISGPRLHVTVEKTHTGKPGGATLARIPEPPEPAKPAPPPLLSRAVKSRSSRRRR